MAARYLTMGQDRTWRALNTRQNKKYLDTIVSVNKAMSLGSATWVYRGVSGEHLRGIFPGTMNAGDKLMEKISYFGEKARFFSEDRSLSRESMRRIDDYNDDLADEIFEGFSELGGRDPDDLGISRLILRDPNFFEFFAKKSKSMKFRHALLEIGSMAFVYYLSILHTAGLPKIARRSGSISSSKVLRVAEDFAGKGDKDGYVITAVHRFRLREDQILVSRLRGAGLPVLPSERIFFPAEKEITLRGALMPHNILHLRKTGTDKYWVNPHLFSSENAETEMASEMLYIDQSDFSERIARETGYSAWFYMLKNGTVVQGGFVGFPLG